MKRLLIKLFNIKGSLFLLESFKIHKFLFQTTLFVLLKHLHIFESVLSIMTSAIISHILFNEETDKPQLLAIMNTILCFIALA